MFGLFFFATISYVPCTNRDSISTFELVSFFFGVPRLLSHFLIPNEDLGCWTAGAIALASSQLDRGGKN